MTNDERDKLMMEIHTAVTVTAEKVQSHSTDLYGNGKPGIKMDVDRLKQDHKRSCKIIWIMVTAIVSVIGRLVYNAITN
jgi:hypothetical protein